MSDDKGKVTDKASEIAKNIWLAGVGAYGKAAGEAQDRLEKAGVETPKLFKDLVKAGTALEEEAKANLNPKQASSSVEERINRVRENFTFHKPGRSDDLASLHQKVDDLSRKIDALADALGTGKKAPVAAKKRPAAKKKMPVKKAATKKAPATRKKPGTRKVTAASKKKTG
jgi:polyhydroxyalkanoate synthesis regulator phasin